MENISSIESSQSISSIKLTSFTTEKIKVFVYFPNYKIISITISTNKSLSLLDTIFKPDLIYIYNGCIVDKNLPISKCNVINDSTIVSVTPSHQNIDKWIKITRNFDDFNNKIKISINHKNQLEISRLKDINFLKNDMKRKKFGCKKPFSKQSFLNNKKSYFSFVLNDDNDKLVTNYTQLEKPSNDPLPILW